MPRLAAVDREKATKEQLERIEAAEKSGAPDPRITSVFVRSEAGRRWFDYWNWILNEGQIETSTKEMCRILISVAHNCGYCSTVRNAKAQSEGLDEDKVMEMLDFENSDKLNDREKAALRYAKLFKLGDDAIDSDEVYQDLKKHFSDEEIIELGLFCGEVDGAGKFARSVQVITWDEACDILPYLKSKTKKTPQAAE